MKITEIKIISAPHALPGSNTLTGRIALFEKPGWLPVSGKNSEQKILEYAEKRIKDITNTDIHQL